MFLKLKIKSLLLLFLERSVILNDLSPIKSVKFNLKKKIKIYFRFKFKVEKSPDVSRISPKTV